MAFQSCYSSKRSQGQRQLQAAQNLSSPTTSPSKPSWTLSSSTQARTTPQKRVSLTPPLSPVKKAKHSGTNSAQSKKKVSPPSTPRYAPLKFISFDDTKGDVVTSSMTKNPSNKIAKYTPSPRTTTTTTTKTDSYNSGSLISSIFVSPSKTHTPKKVDSTPPKSISNKITYVDYQLIEEEEKEEDLELSLDFLGTRSRLQGLRNLGNTCYMNAILQVLTNLNPFVLDLKQTYQQRVQKQAKETKTLFCDAFLALVNEKALKSGVIDPKPLKDRIGQVVERFSGYSQQDAHEFLGSCLNQIEEELSEKILRSATQKDCLKCPVSRFFDFTLEHTLTCCKCGNTSVKPELCRDLSLSLSVGRQSSESNDSFLFGLSLEKLLDRFFQTDKVESICELCGEDKHEAKHRIKSKPSILILHLKRFKASFDYGLATASKITTPIRFRDYLDLSSWCEYRQADKASSQMNESELETSLSALMNKENDPVTSSLNLDSQYKLMGVVVHEGRSTSSGHYVCDIYDEGSDTWSTYNDSLVLERVGKSTIFGADRQANGYILFYRKEN